MKSAIYRGTIRHRRFTTVDHAFQYRMFFMFLDLAEMSRVLNIHPLWSVDRVNLAYFRRRTISARPGSRWIGHCETTWKRKPGGGHRVPRI